jgi:hypothetical protein
MVILRTPRRARPPISTSSRSPTGQSFDTATDTTGNYPNVLADDLGQNDAGLTVTALSDNEGDCASPTMLEKTKVSGPFVS